MMNGFDRDYSALDIGAPNYSRVDGGEAAMQEVRVFEDFFWSQLWQGAKFSDDQEGFKITGEPYTIIDTGSSHFFIPSNIFYPFVIEIFRVAGIKEYAVQYGQVFVECKHKKNLKPV